MQILFKKTANVWVDLDDAFHAMKALITRCEKVTLYVEIGEIYDYTLDRLLELLLSVLQVSVLKGLANVFRSSVLSLCPILTISDLW